MGERELRAKYGGKLPKAINRAIRAEIMGGNEALDTLTALAGPAMQSGWKERNGNPNEPAVAYFKHKRQVVDKMEAEIRRKWGIPLEATRDTKPKRPRPSNKPRRRAGDPADRKPASAYHRGAKKSPTARKGPIQRDR